MAQTMTAPEVTALALARTVSHSNSVCSDEITLVAKIEACVLRMSHQTPEHGQTPSDRRLFIAVDNAQWTTATHGMCILDALRRNVIEPPQWQVHTITGLLIHSSPEAAPHLPSSSVTGPPGVRWGSKRPARCLHERKSLGGSWPPIAERHQVC